MSENTDNNRNLRNDEIDLLDLFNRMGRAIIRGLKGLGTAFMISLIFILRNWLPLTVSFIAGIGLSLLLAKFSGSYFTSDMILKANIKPTDEVIAYINKLQSLCNKNYDRLSRDLRISKEQAKNLMDIQAFWIIDLNRDSIPDYVDYSGRHDVYDTINVRMPDRMDIRVKTKEIQQLTDLQYGLTSYIESKESFIQKNAIRLRQIDEIIARCNVDISHLDSLERVLYSKGNRDLVPGSTSYMMLLQYQKPHMIYSDIYKIYNLKQKLERERDLHKKAISVISDFTVPVQRENGFSYYAGYIIPILLILVLVLLILRKNYSRISEAFDKY